MAIVFHSEKYGSIKLDSHIIIGVSGYDYKGFLKLLTGDSVCYLNSKEINSKKTVYEYVNSKLNNKSAIQYLKDLKLDKDFLNRKVYELSHSEKRLLGYLHMLNANARIIVIDEPFLDLDYENKKRIISLFNKIIKNKSIIIGSNSSDVIYSISKKVLLLGKNKFLYDDVSILSNKSVLKRFNLTMPEIVEFVKLVKDKKVKLSYNSDIRDLIKDVYKHVSK